MKELLSPAGNMECLKAAVLNGADAVYLGGLKFGARAYSKNFDESEIKEAIKFAHLYGVKVYVTVNTMIYSSEVESVINYIEFLYKNNVDAIIVQDIGIINIVRNRFPNLEIHSSTQTHTTNINAINFFKDLGVKRCVLAREMTLDEINNLDTDLELEAFIHGALCVSYSGECLASKMMLNRSANRGECAGVCRLPFKNKKNETGYFLSGKELCTAFQFEEIMKSNIKSLKIEGRMKSPEYVGCVTRLYRDLMDKYYNNEEVIPNEEILHDLTIIYNRDFTKGFILGEKSIINNESSNHKGLKIGNIVKVDKNYIYIKLQEELNQGDGIRFKNTNEGLIVNYLYDENKKLINKANDIVLIKNTFKVEKGEVYKTFGIKLVDKYTKDIERKIDIEMLFKAHLNEKMKLTIKDGNNEITVYGDIPEVSKSISITKENIYEQMKRLGETPFKLKNINVEIDDNLFINKKYLNEIRNKGTNLLKEKRISNNKDIVIKEFNIEKNIINKNISYGILVRNEKMLQKCLKDFDRIYIDDYELYLKYKDNEKIYFKTNRVKENREIKKALVTEIGSTIYNGIGDYYLNVGNEYTLNYLNKYLDLNTLSIELQDEEIERISENNNNFELVLYTHVDLMIIKSNVENEVLYDRNMNEYNLIKENNITHMIDSKKIDKLDKLDYYKSLGINNFRIELLNENDNELEEIKRRIFNYELVNKK